MTSNTERSTWLATLLIGVGVLMLVSGLGWLGWLGGWIWPLLFLVAGGAAVALYLRDRGQPWMLALATALTSVALGSMVGTGPGALLFVALAIGLLLLYLRNSARWWALLSGGAMVTLTLATAAEAIFPTRSIGWLLLLGIAATFALLALLPQERGGQRWALYPALGALALAAMLMFTGAVAAPIALLLVAVGAFLLWRVAPLGERSGPPSEPRRSEGA